MGKIEDQDGLAVGETGTSITLGYLGQDLPFLLRSLHGFIRGVTAESFAGLDNEPSEVAALNLVEINPGITQNDLAGVLAIKKSAVTKVINTLEARGLIARQKGTDRRFNALSLTPKGEERVRELRARMTTQHALLFEGVSETEQRELFGQLRRLLHKISRMKRSVKTVGDL